MYYHILLFWLNNTPWKPPHSVKWWYKRPWFGCTVHSAIHLLTDMPSISSAFISVWWISKRGIARLQFIYILNFSRYTIFLSTSNTWEYTFFNVSAFTLVKNKLRLTLRFVISYLLVQIVKHFEHWKYSSRLSFKTRPLSLWVAKCFWLYPLCLNATWLNNQHDSYQLLRASTTFTIS